MTAAIPDTPTKQSPDASLAAPTPTTPTRKAGTAKSTSRSKPRNAPARTPGNSAATSPRAPGAGSRTPTDDTADLRAALARLDRARSAPERNLARRALRTACEDYAAPPPTRRIPSTVPEIETDMQARLDKIRREAAQYLVQTRPPHPSNPNLTPPRPDILRRNPKGTT